MLQLWQMCLLDGPPPLQHSHPVLSCRPSLTEAERQDVHVRHTGPAPWAAYLVLTT
jgi:hypothetical protein